MEEVSKRGKENLFLVIVCCKENLFIVIFM